jgi:hypothetical protein
VTDHAPSRDDVEEGAGVAGRAGLVARGLVYCLLAVVAVQVAVGGQARELDRRGALQLLARQRFGAALLSALAAGFLAYALWRFAEAALGRQDWPKRLLHAGRGALYLVFTYTAIRLLLGRSSGTSNDTQAKSWSGRVMEHTGGRWLVAAVGLACVVGGLVLFWRGATRSFEKKLRTQEMRGWQRRWLPLLGTVGHASRGLVLGLIGAFLVRAAIRFDPGEAVGVDGALHQVADRTYGTVALLVVALGLASYGLFSFVEARWRNVIGS